MTDETETEQRPMLPALRAGGAVRAIVPQDFDNVYRMANAVCIAGMAPYGLDTPEKATVAILHGLEVGLTPMMALQSIAVINGRPSLWGDGAIGLVQSSGLLETWKEWIEGEGDARTAYCIMKRRGDPETKKGKFSVKDAKVAKLWEKRGRNGQDTPWITNPDRMLQMRARGFAMRDGFADVLRGLAIAEEQRDIEAASVVLERPDVPKPTGSPPKPTGPSSPPKPAAGKPTSKPAESTAGKAGQTGAARTAPAGGQQTDFTETRSDQREHPVEASHEKDRQEGEALSGFGDDDKVVDVVAEPIAEQAEAPKDPNQLLDDLNAELLNAKDEADVETIYANHDLEAYFQDKERGEVFAGMALGYKRQALRRVRHG